jgi:hypothetical protein
LNKRRRKKNIRKISSKESSQPAAKDRRCNDESGEIVDDMCSSLTLKKISSTIFTFFQLLVTMYNK